MTEINLNDNKLEIATDLAIAWLSNPNTRASADDVSEFLHKTHAAILTLNVSGNPVEENPEQEHEPAVSVRKSLSSKDHIISMIDGKPYRTLRRHLSSNGLTPEDYRARYNLAPDYPMVAPAYSEQRRAMAKQIGLGRKRQQTSEPAPEAGPAPTPAKRNRR